MKTVSHILDRAEATLRTHEHLEDWQWPERTPQQWRDGIKELKDRHWEEYDAQGVNRIAKFQWDLKLEAIHVLTTAIVRLGRVRYRTNPHKAGVFDYVKPDAKSRMTILGAAERLAELWRKLDAGWVPLEDVALDDFDQLLEQAAGAKKNAIATEVDWILAGAAMEESSAVLDDDCVAWYATATAVFPEGTLLGDHIRRIVPTTTVPQPPPDQSEVTKLELTAEGTLRLEFDAKHGTRFTVLYRGPGEAQSRALVVDVKEKFIEIPNAAAGAHHFKVMASNSRGDGAESEEAVFEVPARQAA